MKTPLIRKPYTTPTFARETLAHIKREMERPHRAESTKKNADTHANGGHLGED